MAAPAIGGIGGAGLSRTAGLRGLDPSQRADSGWRTFGKAEGPSFADSLKLALGEVSGLQERAKDAIGAFLRGEPVEMHEVMAATEEAGIALELLIEMRNKLTEAYRAVMNMQG